MRRKSKHPSLIVLLTTTPRVPCSTFFSTPSDGGVELMSVMSEETSERSGVTLVRSEFVSELGEASETPLDLGIT